MAGQAATHILMTRAARASRHPNHRISGGYRRSTPVLAIILLFLATLSNAHGESRSDEAAVKVAFLYNFFKYIDWPDTSTGATMTLCTTRNPALTDALSVLFNKKVKGRPLRILQDIKPEQIDDCHLLFIDLHSPIDTFLSRARAIRAVTVGDDPDFIDRGGIIGLIRQNNRLAFEVNLEQAKQQGLYIDAQLLKLAHRVVGDFSVEAVEQ